MDPDFIKSLVAENVDEPIIRIEGNNALIFGAPVRFEGGFHGRPTAVVVRECLKYDSGISFTSYKKPWDRHSGKSIMDCMSMGIAKGERVNIYVEGADKEDPAEIAHRIYMAVTSDGEVPNPDRIPYRRVE
jgi:phosphotransferase system HPr (HPr) family protein